MQRSAHGLQAFASARVFMCMDWWHRVADFPMNRWNDSHNHSFPFSYLSVKVNRNESEQSHAFYESEDCLANVDNMCPTHQQPIFSCIHNNGKSKHLSASKQTKKLTVYKSIVKVRMITEREPKLKRYTYSKRFAQKAFEFRLWNSCPTWTFLSTSTFLSGRLLYQRCMHATWLHNNANLRALFNLIAYLCLYALAEVCCVRSIYVTGF